MLTVSFEDSEDLGSGDALDLSDTVAVSEDNTNLRWSHTLSGKLEDLLRDLLGSNLEPSWGGSLVGKSGAGDTLVGIVHTTLQGVNVSGFLEHRQRER